MKYMEMIERRQSIREFRRKELSAKQIQEIRDYFDKIEGLIPEIDVELVISTGDEVKKRAEGSTGYRGYSFGAPSYLTILSEKADHYMLNAGYIAECLILKLVEMELDNCWLTTNGSENAKRALLIENNDKEAVAVIACGFGKKETVLKRLDIQNPSNVKVKRRSGHIAPKIAQNAMVFDGKWGNPVDWDSVDPQLDRAFYAATLAPSFLNKQQYRYILTEDKVILYCQREDVDSDRDDLILSAGATMANFSLIYVKDKGWKCDELPGNEDYGVPGDYRYAAYYELPR